MLNIAICASVLLGSVVESPVQHERVQLYRSLISHKYSAALARLDIEAQIGLAALKGINEQRGGQQLAEEALMSPAQEISLEPSYRNFLYSTFLHEPYSGAGITLLRIETSQGPRFELWAQRQGSVPKLCHAPFVFDQPGYNSFRGVYSTRIRHNMNPEMFSND